MKQHPFAAVAVAIAAALAGASSADAQEQQPAYNYFARTPQSEAVLRSNELHHLSKGVANLQSGKRAELVYARNEFDFILRYWPNHPRVLLLQAETLLRLGHGAEIDQYYDRAYQMTPDAAELHISHGVALLKMNKVDDAIGRLQRGVELEPDSMAAHYNLGLALVRAKRLEEANRHAQKAYALGYPLPGLQEQLEKAGAWRPALPAVDSADAAKKAE